MALTLLAPPSGEPVTLSEFKEHIRIDHTVEDVALTGFLAAARQGVEARGGIALMAQQWRLSLDECPRDDLILPLQPLLSVDNIAVIDGQNVAQTVDVGDYDVAIGGQGRVAPTVAWPRPGVKLDGVHIDFTAGWAAAGLVPDALKQAVKLLAAHFYETREAALANRIQTIPSGVDALLAPYKRVRI